MTLTTKRRLPVRHIALMALMVVGIAATACTPRELGGIAQNLINEDRADARLAPLAWDDNAGNKAQAWAEHMAADGRISHSNLTSGITGNWTVLAENVGYASSVNRAQELFMQSSRHRAAILNPRFTAVGVGVAQAGGSYYVVQVFRG